MFKKSISVGAILTVFLIVAKYDSNDDLNIERMLTGGSDTAVIAHIYSCPLYKKALTLWLPFLSRRGFLDTLIVHE